MAQRKAATAARRYARALFELAHEQQQVEAVREELGAFARAASEDPELRRALLSPLLPTARRRELLAQIAERAGMSPLLRRFLVFLIDQRRIVELPAIAAELERLADEAAGRLRAEVVAPAPLAESQLDRLRRALAARTGREVELEVRVDPSLIAGAVARVGDLVFDGSLRTQLARLRASLVKGR